MRTIGPRLCALSVDEVTADVAEFMWRACCAFAHTSTERVAHLKLSALLDGLQSMIRIIDLMARIVF